MSEELRFSDYMSAAANDSQESVTEDAAVDTTTEPTISEPTQETVEHTEDNSAADVEPSSPVQEQEPVNFEDVMRSHGLEAPEGIDRRQLYESALQRINEGTLAMQQAAELKAELERLKSQAVAPSAAPQQSPQQATVEVEPAPNESAQEFGERLFKELKHYDNSLLQYVERDENTGRYRPRAEYGSTAVEAAQTINAYNEAEQRQAEMLLRNPSLLVKDHMGEFERMAEKKAEAIVEARLQKMQEEQQRQTEEQRQQMEAQEQQRQLSEWHESNKAKLFHLGENGEPLKSVFGDNDFSKTQVGTYFLKTLSELRSEFPGASELALRNRALREAELAVPQSQPKPAQAQQAPQKFVEQRGQAAPNQSVPPASGNELLKSEGKLQFASLARAIPENQERMTSWSH